MLLLGVVMIELLMLEDPPRVEENKLLEDEEEVNVDVGVSPASLSLDNGTLKSSLSALTDILTEKKH